MPSAGRVLHVSELGKALGREPLPETELPTLAPTDPACVVWTSGTTGVPKGAVYDHERMAAISRNIGQLTEPGDRRLVVLPFAHVGYMTRMWDELANATTIVLAGEPWSAGETLRLIRDEHITMGTGVPTQWELVLAHPDLASTDFSELRVCGIGGAAISPDLVRRMRETLECPVISRYTSTEAGVTTSTIVGDDDEIVATTVGRAAPDIELRVVDPASRRPSCPRVTSGEILVRSPAMMRGYWQDPETHGERRRRRRLAAHRRPRHDRRRRHRPHRRSAEGDVHPRWVQRVPRRGGGGALRPPLDRPGRGRRAPRSGPRRDRRRVRGRRRPGRSPPELADLRDWCKARIADYKAPDRLVVVDALPVTAMHKVDKAALAALTHRMTREDLT